MTAESKIGALPGLESEQTGAEGLLEVLFEEELERLELDEVVLVLVAVLDEFATTIAGVGVGVEAGGISCKLAKEVK